MNCKDKKDIYKNINELKKLSDDCTPKELKPTILEAYQLTQVKTLEEFLELKSI